MPNVNNLIENQSIQQFIVLNTKYDVSQGEIPSKFQEPFSFQLIRTITKMIILSLILNYI